MVWSVGARFGAVSAYSFPSIAMWLVIHVSVIPMFIGGVVEVGDINGYFVVVCLGISLM